MSGLNSRWTKGLSPKEAYEVKRALVGSRNFIEQLREVLKNVEDELRNEKEGKPKYEDAAWPYRQAHLNGMLDSLSKLDQILPTDETLEALTKELKEIKK